MPTAVKMPKLGLSMVEGKVVKWLKAEGDRVDAGEPIVVVETNKITYEVESPSSGVLYKILVAPKAVAPVAGPLGVIAAPGEQVDLSEFQLETTVPEAALPGGFDPLTTQLGREGRGHFGDRPRAPQPAAQPAAVHAGLTAVVAPTGRPKASPLARKIAAAGGINLTTVVGTGPRGRIEKRDVEHALQSLTAGPTPTVGRSAAPAAAVVGSDAYPPLAYALMRKAPDRQPLAGTMRQVIAEHMRRSKQTAAHATMSLRADVSRLIEVRKRILERTAERHGVRVTFTDLIVKAVARALVYNPMMRTVIDGDDLVTMNDIDIAIAIHLEEAGLVVPVIRDCDTKSLIEIAKDRTRLMEAARAGRLALDDLAGGCFSVTNMGAVYDIDFGTPILNLPQSAILGVGSIQDDVVAENGQAVVRPVMNLFLSIDHCVIDGEPSVRFLNELREIIQDPEVGFAIY
jgi:pyruvate dehydrogenase E2 component (dihydrolipoamide acetyltransferase)